MSSFEEILQQYEPMIYKIFRQLNIYSIDEEWIQVARIALWEAYERFDETKGSFINYAYTYVKGKLLVELTKHSKLKRQPLVQEEVTIIDFETELLLQKCLSLLNENEQIYLAETFYNQLSINEIARKYGVHPSSVKYWRKCTKRKLLKNMEFF